MKKNIRRKVIAFAVALGLLLPGFSAVPAVKAQAKTPVVVCIDPGHGGTNGGAAYNGLWEKDLTLQIATAMYQELSLYEGVTVIMTRTADVDLTLAQRAQFAADAGADFLYSIHLNASPSHNLFGSEVWVSAYDSYYAKGMSFGNIALQQLTTDVGVYPRGVKTKMSSKGTGDYYGIINTIKSFLDALRALDTAGLAHGFALLVPFGIGVLLGIFLIAKLITFLFEKFGVQTYCAILGLIVASPFAIFYNTGALNQIPSFFSIVVGLVLAGIFGFVTYKMGD